MPPSGCCGTFDTRVRSPLDELDALWSRNAAEFDLAIRAMFAALAKRATNRDADVDATEDRVARVIGRAAGLSDLLGRRRAVLEFRAAKRRAVFATVAAPDEVAALPHVEFIEAMRDILARTPEIRRTAEEVANLYETQHGFAMARSTRIALTRKVQRMIGTFIREGTTVPKASELIARAGDFTKSYAEVVYRTNLNTAYTAGRFQQAADPDILDVMPAFEYLSQNDSNVRRGRKKDRGENHYAANGLIAATTDPIWDSHSPPSGYNCRCTIRLVSRFELERRGLYRDGRVIAHRPASLGQFQAHPNFGGGRPDRAIYFGQASFSSADFRRAWPASAAAEVA